MGHAQRLHYSWEYRKFFKGSEVFRFGLCTVYRISNTAGHFRLGITLKARGSSIERNRVKRQIREAFRIHAPNLGCFDYNVVIPASVKIDFVYARKLGQMLQKEIRRGLRDSKVR